MKRAAAVVLGFAVVSGSSLESRAESAQADTLRLYADLDDDDDDGIADGHGGELSKRSLVDVHWLAGRGRTAAVRGVSGEAVRVIAGRRALLGTELGGGPRRDLGLLGVRAGRAEVALGAGTLTVDVVEVRALDASEKAVDLVRSHASISRSLPAFLAVGEADGDALRWLFVGDPDALPEIASVSSTRPDGSKLDEIASIALGAQPCPGDVSGKFVCKSTPPIRATSDAIDRAHPESSARSLRAEVGGRIEVRVEGKKVVQIRVGGPRHSALGPLARFRGKLRVRVLRNAPGGAPALGGSSAEALRLAQSEIDTASQLWGQCGIHFGMGRDLDVAVVDPPPPHLISVGCNFGLPGSGGEVRFAVGKRKFALASAVGETPLNLAGRIAEALNKAGIRAEVSPNPRISAGVLGSVDVLAKGAAGKPVAFETDGDRPLSTDPTLAVCLGTVDLGDGLSHFGDFDAAAGTLEERTLIKAFDDGDPSTIEVFIVPAFAESARIGESFIYTEGSNIRNTVIIDRAAVRAGARSFALAHELGHVILEMAGHPDDFGVDRPSSLMDADAADPTIFGPRRLSVAECERAILQSGPNAPVPLLQAWPLFTPAR